MIELSLQPGDRHAVVALALIQQADVVAITSMIVINGTLGGVLAFFSPRVRVLC